MNDDWNSGNYRVKRAHGNDTGILICEASGNFISPVLFMQAVCPDTFPVSLNVGWRKPVAQPKQLAAKGVLPVLYGECGRIPGAHAFLHLFSLPEPVGRTFVRAGQLADWNFPVRLRGIVVLFEYKYDDAASGAFVIELRRILRRAPRENTTLKWVQNQQLPYLIAAMGYNTMAATDYGAQAILEKHFRESYNVPADIPILAGPPLENARLERAGRGAAPPGYGSFLERTNLTLDREYARAVLRALANTFAIAG